MVGRQQLNAFAVSLGIELADAGKALGCDFSRLPFSLKVLLENLLRHEDGQSVTTDDIKAFADWIKNKSCDREIAYRPARVLMQDFTGVPAVVDLAAMRDAVKKAGGNPDAINARIIGCILLTRGDGDAINACARFIDHGMC